MSSMESSMSDERPSPMDENDKHMAGSLPADPMADAKPANREAAKIIALRNSRPQVFSVAELFQKIVDEANLAPPLMGLSTGHHKLDKWLCGLRPMNITTLGARTSFGKTSKALQIADLAMGASKNVLFVSGEDSALLCGKRFMARRARVNALRLRSNQCHPHEKLSMEQALLAAEKSPFLMDAIGIPVEDIAAEIRERAKTDRIDLVIVDYLQCFSVRRRNQDRRNEITYIAKTVSDTIKNINAAGLLLSQMKRPDGGNPNKPPTMFELKESGDIENASEHILIGHIEDNNGVRTRKIKVEKNKDGPVPDKWLDMPFDDVTASFNQVKSESFGDTGDDDYGVFQTLGSGGGGGDY